MFSQIGSIEMKKKKRSRIGSNRISLDEKAFTEQVNNPDEKVFVDRNDYPNAKAFH
jgi:hypothetical protein